MGENEGAEIPTSTGENTGANNTSTLTSENINRAILHEAETESLKPGVQQGVRKELNVSQQGSEDNFPPEKEVDEETLIKSLQQMATATDKKGQQGSEVNFPAEQPAEEKVNQILQSQMGEQPKKIFLTVLADIIKKFFNWLFNPFGPPKSSTA